MPGAWHNEMEAQFCARGCEKEVKYGNRRADIRLSSKFTCEIQKKLLDVREVSARKRDYAAHDTTIVWLIHGLDANCDLLSSGNYLIELNHEWQYKSYQDAGYKFIIICIEDKFFKIELCMIKCKMIVVAGYETLENVINRLVDDPTNIWSLWGDDYTLRSTMKMVQQGDGNGKTYWLIRSICENKDKNTHVLITKQHAAKTNLYKELIAHESRHEFHIEHNVKNLRHALNGTQSHIIINYTHKKTGREVTVVIGTVDSLIHTISSKVENKGDMFQTMCENITDNGVHPKVSVSGNMKFGGENIYLNKETEILIDEAQDLQRSYAMALVRTMLDTGCDIVMVGDKLQSLMYADNIFVTMMDEDLPGINVVRPPPTNDNRRSRSLGGSEHKKMINYEKYGLPGPTPLREDEDNGNPFVIIDFKKDDEENLCEQVMEIYKHHVNVHNYLPRNFMLVFTIISGQTLPIRLADLINEFWKDRNNDDVDRAMVHQSDDGRSIELNDSIELTRLVSTHSAKGDGRDVVFCMNFTEKNLRSVGRDADGNPSDGLCYESHLNVGVSRHERFLYFALEEGLGDDVSMRLSGIGLCHPRLPTMTKYCTANKLISTITDPPILEIQNITDFEKLTTDYGHHYIKWAVAAFALMVEFDKGDHIHTIMRGLKKKEINIYPTRRYWNKLNNIYPGKMEDIPVMKQPNDDTGTIIKSTCEYIIKNWEKHHMDFPVYERIVSFWLFKTIQEGRYSDFSMHTLSIITKKLKQSDEYTKEAKLYDQLKNTDHLITKLRADIPQVARWNICYSLWIKGRNESFSIRTHAFECIGYDEDNVYHVVLTTELSSMNQPEIVKKLIVQRYVIHNSNTHNYKGKNIITYVAELKYNKLRKMILPDPADSTIVSDIRDAIVGNYSTHHDNINKYLMYIKANPGVWKMDGYTTPFEMIYNMYTNSKSKIPSYVIEFFKDLHEKWIAGKKAEVKAMYPRLVDHLDTKLHLVADDFMGLTEQIDEDF